VRYLLDSNVVIKMIAGNAGILSRVHACQPRDIGIPAITAYEIYTGALKSEHSQRNLTRLLGLQFEIVAFDAQAAMHAASTRAMLEKAGMPIGPYDMLIAGQALALGLILVTHNTREFRRVANLTIEDWQS